MPDEFMVCPECGTRYPATGMGGFSGMCPRCMIAGVSSEVLRMDEVDDRQVGNYQLEERIGVGGMGTVWRATQSEPVRREVAVKIIKLGMDTEEVVARFENERQALAAMDHPNIAVVFDAGATDEGRPYFVMELIKGEPIVSFCKRHKLDLTARLQLFMQLCSAVEHAHQKGVIHRDLKPSNVLVAGSADEPVVKVIDFGVAKATEQHDFEYTLFTQAGQMIGTPAYMSPEQAGATADVDVRSDVYALGVLLYEILVGRPPFEERDLKTVMIEESRRIIREVDPPRPSTMAGRPDSVRRNDLVGDLDWITMKALEKDRDRRYGSAAAFGEDIRRFFDNEPVTAAAPSAIYRTRKFCRKYRVFLFSMAAVVTALCVGGALAVWQAQRASRSAEAEEATKLKALESLADSYVNSGLHAGDAGDYGKAQLWFTLAAEVAREAGVAELERACRLRAATFERAGPVPVRRVPFADSWRESWMSEFDASRRFLKVSRDDYFTLADLETEDLADFGTGSTGFHAVDVSPDGKQVALSIAPGTIRIVDVTTHETTAELELPASETDRRLNYLKYSPDGRFLFCSAGNGWVRELGEDAWMDGRIPFGAPVRWAVFSPDSRQLLTMDCGIERDIRRQGYRCSVFSVPAPLEGEEWQPRFEPVVHRSFGLVSARDLPRFYDQGRALSYLGGPNRMQHSILIDAETGEQLSMTKHDGAGRVTPDRTVLTTGIGTMQDAVSGAKIRDIPGNGRYFTADGSSIVSSSGMVYDIDSADLWYRLWPDPMSVGTELFARTDDGQLFARPGLVWAMARPLPYHHLQDRPFGAFSWSADDRFILPASASDGTRIVGIPSLKVYDCATGDPVGGMPLDESLLMHACFSPRQSERVAWAGAAEDRTSGSVHFVDWRKGGALLEPLRLTSAPLWLSIHPSGEWLAVLCADGKVLRMDLATGETGTLFVMENIKDLSGYMHEITARMRFLDGGNDLAVWGLAGGFHMWDVGLGKLRYVIADDFLRNRLSHAGDVMVATTFLESDIAPVFDRRTGEPLAHRIPASALRLTHSNDLSPDGKRLLWADSKNRDVRLWDWRGGKEAMTAIRAQESIHPHAVLIPSHNAVAVWGVDGIGERGDEIGFYDLRDGKPLCPNVIVGLKIIDLEVSPGGRYLGASFGYPRGNAAVFDLDAWFSEGKHAGLGAEDRMLIAEINSQARIVDGALEHLSLEEWDQRWKEFRKRHPDYHPLELGEAEMKRWHRNHTARPFARRPPLDWHQRRLDALNE